MPEMEPQGDIPTDVDKQTTETTKKKEKKIKKISSIDLFMLKFQKIPEPAKIFLLQNLSVMIKAGISLADAVDGLTEQTQNKKLQHILRTVGGQIREGKGFGESLEPYQKDFGEIFVNMIKAGEMSGQLEDILHQLYIQTKKSHTIKAKIKNAMIYPVVILMAMVGISVFVLVFVLPKLTSMFDDLSAELPIATRVLMGISKFVQSNGLLVGISTVIIAGVAIQFFSTKAGKKFLSTISLKLPIMGPIIKQINLAKNLHLAKPHLPFSIREKEGKTQELPPKNSALLPISGIENLFRNHWI